MWEPRLYDLVASFLLNHPIVKPSVLEEGIHEVAGAPVTTEVVVLCNTLVTACWSANPYKYIFRTLLVFPLSPQQQATTAATPTITAAVPPPTRGTRRPRIRIRPATGREQLLSEIGNNA